MFCVAEISTNFKEVFAMGQQTKFTALFKLSNEDIKSYIKARTKAQPKDVRRNIVAVGFAHADK